MFQCGCGNEGIWSKLFNDLQRGKEKDDRNNSDTKSNFGIEPGCKEQKDRGEEEPWLIMLTHWHLLFYLEIYHVYNFKMP